MYQIHQIRGFEIFSITKKMYVNPSLRRLILQRLHQFQSIQMQ